MLRSTANCGVRACHQKSLLCSARRSEATVGLGRERREGRKRVAGYLPPRLLASPEMLQETTGQETQVQKEDLPSPWRSRPSLSIRLALNPCFSHPQAVGGESLRDHWAPSSSPGPEWRPHQDLCPSKFWRFCIWQGCGTPVH